MSFFLIREYKFTEHHNRVGYMFLWGFGLGHLCSLQTHTTQILLSYSCLLFWDCMYPNFLKVESFISSKDFGVTSLLEGNLPYRALCQSPGLFFHSNNHIVGSIWTIIIFSSSMRDSEL